MIDVCIDVDGGGLYRGSWLGLGAFGGYWSWVTPYYSGARASVIFSIEPENFFGYDANAEESCGLPVAMAVAS